MAELGLLTALSVALVVALAGGVLARALRLPAIIGYLGAGIALSPFTPGYVADVHVIRQLADLGVIFLMFGIGLHIRLADLLRVRGVAVPAALIRMAAIIGLTVAAGTVLHLGTSEAIALGLTISITSTVVTIRALDERGELDSLHGRIVVGWLVVEDLATVVILTVLPALAPHSDGNVLAETALGLGKAVLFVGIMLTAGSWLVRWLLGRIARTGSRELFILATIGGALGIATGAAAFGVSVALGAFIAGVAISEAETSHQAAADVLPFRDAFAVLFFVSTGMLLDPVAVAHQLPALAIVLALVVVAKAVLALSLAGVLRQNRRTSATLAMSLAQIGEFSFIVAQQATGLGIMSAETYNVVLAVAVLSTTISPLLVANTSRLEQALRRLPWPEPRGMHTADVVPAGEHVIVAGFGRVGRLSGHAMTERGQPFVVIDADFALIRELRGAGIHAVWGDSANAEVLTMAGVEHARALLLAVPDESTALLAAANARRLNPHIEIVVRAPAAESAQALRRLGVTQVVVPEYEGGIEMMRELLVALGVTDDEATELAHRARGQYYVSGPPLHLPDAVPDPLA